MPLRQFLNRLLRQVPVSGPEAARSRMFSKLNNGILLMAYLLELFNLFVHPGMYMRWLSIAAGFTVLWYLARSLQQRGRVGAAALFLSSYLHLMLVFLAYSQGGIYARAIQFIPITLLIVGVFFDLRRTLFFGLWVGASLGVLHWVQAEELLAPPRIVYTITERYISLYVLTFLVVFIQRMNIDHLRLVQQESELERQRRQQTEQALATSEALRRRFIDQHALPMALIDAESFRLIDLNPAAVQLLGLASTPDYQRLGLLDLSPEMQYNGQASMKLLGEHSQLVAQTGGVSFDWQYRRPDGLLWDAEVHLVATWYQGKAVLQASLVDVSGRKQLELSLKATTERIHNIGNNFADGMFYQVVVGPGQQRRFTYLSDSVQTLYGVSAQEAMANPMLIYQQVYPADAPALAEAEGKAVAQLSTFRMEARLINPDGSLRWSSFVSTPTRLADDVVRFDGIEFIITHRVRVEETLRLQLRLQDFLVAQSTTFISLPYHQFGPALHKALAELGELMNCDRLFLVDYRPQLGQAIIDHEWHNSQLQPLVPELAAIDLVRVEPMLSLHRRGATYWFSASHQPDLNPFAQSLLARGMHHLMAVPLMDGPLCLGFVGCSSQQPERRFGPSEESLLTLFGQLAINLRQRQLAEEQHRISSAQLQTSLNYSPHVAIQWYNLQGEVIFWNHASELIYGWQADETMGRTLDQLIFDAQQTQLFLQVLAQIAETGEGFGPSEFRVMRKDGTYIWIIVSIFSFPISSTELGFACIDLDITERKLTENRLRESEERYRKLVEAFPDIIMVSDLQGNVVFGNEALHRIAGIGPHDYRNPNRAARVHPDDRPLIQQAVAKLLTSADSYTPVIENRYIHPTGAVLWFSGRIAKFEHDGQLLLQTISRDITQQKLIEEELARHRDHLEDLVQRRTQQLADANLQLTELNSTLFQQKEELQQTVFALQSAQERLLKAEKMASLGVLAAGVAHEVNNPLNFIAGGILGIETYLADRNHLVDEELETYLHAVNEGVRRASTIVTSLNHYSRSNELPFAPVGLHGVIDHCLSMLHNRIKNRIQVQRQFEASHNTLFGSEGQLHQVFLNILTNSQQALAEGGSIRIHTFCSDDATLCVQIHDNGPGIAPEHLPRIFDPFFTTKAPGEGTGLGLSFAYNIVVQHGGTIAYTSVPGQGTTATLHFPLLDTKQS